MGSQRSRQGLCLRCYRRARCLLISVLLALPLSAATYYVDCNSTSWNQTNTTYNSTTLTFRTNEAADGTLSASTAVTQNCSAGGYNAYGTASYFSGYIGELIIYNGVTAT